MTAPRETTLRPLASETHAQCARVQSFPRSAIVRAGVLLVLGSMVACTAGPQRVEARADTSTASTSASTVGAIPFVAADTQRVVLAVKGMYCESCEATVRAMLLRTAGVRSATVDAKTGQAVVVYEASKVTPASIATAVTRLGYAAQISKS